MISLLFYLTHFSSALLWLKDTVLGSGPSICQGTLPNSPYHVLYDALVCGSTLPAGHEKQLFVDTGLIHLMVVSGSHLIFLEMLLGFLPRRIRLAILGGYCYLTGFQAPVVRAFLRRALALPLRARLGTTSLQLEAAAVCAALLLYPEWLVSRSFLMSWMCGLALCLPKILPRTPHFDQALKSYFFLLPFCWASPLSVGWNTLLAPFVGIILFPACVFAVAFPFAVGVGDWMWAFFLRILELGPQAPQFPIFFSSRWLCWIPIVTHSALLVAEVRWRRAHAFLPLSFS